MRPKLSPEQSAAAELRMRQEIAERDWEDPQEEIKHPPSTAAILTVLEFFIRRTFRKGRTAAYFRTFRELGEITELNTHAHPAFKWLVDRKVLRALPAEHNAAEGYWYAINTKFLEWDVQRKRLPAAFMEAPALPWEPSLEELLREAVGENLSAVSAVSVGATESARGRDTGPAPVPHPDNAAAGLTAPSLSLSSTHSEPTCKRLQREITADDFARLKKAVLENRIAEEFPESVAASAYPAPVQKDVPSPGTPENPEPCTRPGYAQNASVEGRARALVPAAGTAASLASLALTTKAQLATDHVPGSGTPDDKALRAYRWLESVDITKDLKVERFAKAWMEVCEKQPDYVLSHLPVRLARQLQQDGKIEKPLALLAKIARDDGKMRVPRTTRK